MWPGETPFDFRGAARARRRRGLSRKDPRCADYPPQAMVDAFEASLVKYVVASAEWR